MTEELQNLLDAVKRYKLQNGRHEYLVQQRETLFSECDALSKEIHTITKEIDEICFSNEALGKLIKAALDYPFDEIRDARQNKKTLTNKKKGKR